MLIPILRGLLTIAAGVALSFSIEFRPRRRALLYGALVVLLGLAVSAGHTPDGDDAITIHGCGWAAMTTPSRPMLDKRAADLWDRFTIGGVEIAGTATASRLGFSAEPIVLTFESPGGDFAAFERAIRRALPPPLLGLDVPPDVRQIRAAARAAYEGVALALGVGGTPWQATQASRGAAGVRATGSAARRG